MMNLIKGLFDEYDRNARLSPAFLVGLPFLIAFLSVVTFDEVKAKAMFGLVSFLGVFYLASSISRDLGYKAQERLAKKWKGMPTTELLRHRDNRIDVHTKEAYHLRLSQGIGKQFPAQSEEQNDPVAVDQLYVAGTKWLIGQTKDTTKFNLLFKSNIAYGYRRNAYGLRWLGVLSCVLVIAFEVVVSGIITVGPSPTLSLSTFPASAGITIGIDLVLLAIWLFYFTESTVHSAGFTYGERLLECCSQV